MSNFKKGNSEAYVRYKPFHDDKKNGKQNRSLKEPVPLPYKRSGDAIISATDFGGIDNNARIHFGRDRDPFGKGKRKKKEFEDVFEDRISQVSGYSDFMGAGAIDIVVGAGAPFPVDLAELNRPNNLPPLYQTENAPKLKSKTLIDGETKHPGILMDAARVYITQMGDIDDYFDFHELPGPKLDDNPSSGIVIKADRARVHARRDVKIISGGDGGYNIDSCGYQIKETPGIHLIAGNGRATPQQPMVLGENLVKCLNGIYKIIQDNLELTNKLAITQMTLNNVVSHSIRVNPAGPSAPDPISQINNLLKQLSDVQDLMSVWFQKFVNVPLANEQNFCGTQSNEYILSKFNTNN